MRLIFPFWSGFDKTHIDWRFPVILSTKSSLHSCVMSFRNLPSKREAHFCFTSAFSFYDENKCMSLILHHQKFTNPFESIYLQFIFTVFLLLQRHSFLMFFIEFSFGRLKIKPCVWEWFDEWQKRFDKWVKLVLQIASRPSVIIHTKYPRVDKCRQQ